ncbi:MAG TPA: PAS domain S-box protein [Bacilli bacterium]|nr:PAS domain S-box protein [Bacilli bacterium]
MGWAVAYLVVSLLWALYSQGVLALLTNDADLYMRLDRLNDLLYVAVSGYCLWLFARSKNDWVQRAKAIEQRYDSLFHHHPEALYVLGRDGKMLAINKVGVTIGGYTLDELKSTMYNEEIMATTADLELVRDHVRRALEGEAVSDRVRVISKTGQEMVFRLTHFPLIVDGEIVGVYGSARDVTEKVRTRAELTNTKQQLESFIQNSADAIIVIDLEGGVKFINVAFENLFGWSRDEIRGMPIPVIPEHLREEAIATLEEVMLTGAAFTDFETKRRRKDGSEVYVSVSVSPVRNTEGKVVAVSAVYRDITEKKRTEELLLKSEKLTVAGQLAAGIAHEIRNPLTAIKGLAKLMEEEQSYNRSYLEIILSELERIDTITGEFLLLAKPQAAAFERKDVRQLLERVLSLMEPQAAAQRVQVVARLAQDLPTTCCAENQLKQVFLNVLKNAVEAMPQGGDLIVEAQAVDLSEKDGQAICVRFIDRGCGIPQERIKKLGEPFYTTKEKGTGLGLMISYKIVKEHNGWIQYASTPGQGTTVEVYLPICDC